MKNKADDFQSINESHINGNVLSNNKMTKTLKTLKKPRIYDKSQADDPMRIQNFLLTQFQEFQSLFKSIQIILPVHKLQTQKAHLDDYRNYEDSIQRKAKQIKQIEEQIKILKNGSYYQYKKMQESPLQVLWQQMRSNCENLKQQKSKYNIKRKEFEKKKFGMREIEEKFKEKCWKQHKDHISFEQFKQKKQKKNDKPKKLNKKSSQPSILNEISQRQEYKINPQSNVHEHKKIKDLLHNRNVAQSAVKNARKRHTVQINQLMGKLQFLQDESHQLDQKLVLKKEELQEAQNRFSASRIEPLTTKTLLKRKTKYKNSF